MPSRQTPFPKQAFPAFPGQGWHCCPKKPAQHSLVWKPRNARLRVQTRVASTGLQGIVPWDGCRWEVNDRFGFLAAFQLCWSLAMLLTVPGLRHAWGYPSKTCAPPAPHQLPALPMVQPSAAFNLPISAASNKRPIKILSGTALKGCVYLVGIMRRVTGVPGFYRDRNDVLTMVVLAHFGWHPIWMVYVLMLFSERMQYFFSPA